MTYVRNAHDNFHVFREVRNGSGKFIAKKSSMHCIELFLFLGDLGRTAILYDNDKEFVTVYDRFFKMTYSALSICHKLSKISTIFLYGISTESKLDALKHRLIKGFREINYVKKSLLQPAGKFVVNVIHLKHQI